MVIRILFLVLTSTACWAQLNTRGEAERFIVKNFRIKGLRYDSFLIKPPSPEYDEFVRADFNRDGKLDLLVYGTAYGTVENKSVYRDEIVIILNSERPEKVEFSDRFFGDFVSTSIPPPKVTGDIIVLKEHRLMVENKHIIPYLETPSSKTISSVELKTDLCYGPCPVFEIFINHELKVDYEGKMFVDKIGKYSLSIDRKDWNYLVKLIKNTRVEDLQDEYFVEWTDDQTGYLTIYFTDGTKKIIRDYGMRGTLGLGILYDFLFEQLKF